ncbi:MAG TPA: hypothetical protein VGQ76_22370, partial [Thermoanaerobaculia bacterium]|nr:hypothetical protein [Thermoanaerobaculia bacterium]
MTTFAGQTGGAVDGPGVTALFAGPMDVAVHDGNIYVADSENHTIRRISADGLVTTFVGLAQTVGTANATGSEGRFNNPVSLAADPSGNIYVADYGNITIRKITPTGSMTTFAGTLWESGSADGTGADARFQQPTAIATDHHGNVFVADYNNTIRKITPAGVVTTLAGLANVPGTANGNGSAARFNSPRGIAADSKGNVYVADSVNHTIRKITPAGEVTTFAGSPGWFGNSNGTGEAARFYFPDGIAIDDSDNIYVAESATYTIRKISPD